MEADTSYKKLLYVWTPELLSFHINAIYHQLSSPSNLRLWGKTNLGLCQLCKHQNSTLFHILNCCNYSLHNGRYNWRHDQTLRAIASGLAPYIEEANQRKIPTTQASNFTSTIAFCTADGTKYKNPVLPLPKHEVKDVLTKASDWLFLMDEEHTQIVFPPEIMETAKRPISSCTQGLPRMSF